MGLLVLGVVMVSSASMAVRPLESGADPVASAAESGVTASSIIFSRSTAYFCLASLAMFAAALLPVRRLAGLGSRAGSARAGYLGLASAAFVLLAVLASVYIPAIARPVNGSHRWVDLGLPGLESAQPSEFVKWAIVPVVAWYACAAGLTHGRGGKPRIARFWTGLIPALLFVGLVSGAVVLEDLGTGALVASASCVVLLAAGARLWHFMLMAPPAVGLVLAAIITSPYRVRRITAFLDPFADPQNSGYHMVQSMATISGGGPYGRGLGHGLQKFGYLPEDTTDFLFAVICEELGLAGAALVLTLFGIILWIGLGIARRAEDRLLRLIAVGVVATVTLQACINLVVVTGLGPTKGIALPLVSAGGTGWVLTALMLGVLVAIDRVSQPEASTERETERDTEPEGEPSSEAAAAVASQIEARPVTTLGSTPGSTLGSAPTRDRSQLPRVVMRPVPAPIVDPEAPGAPGLAG